MNELQEFAKRLSGEYYDFTVMGAEEEAKKKGIVIVYGASDDLCELRGAIYDEFDCYNGGTAYITQDGEITKDKKDSTCRRITAFWCSNDDGWYWTYDVDFPHEVFELYDHGEKYCRGLVFYLKDIRTEISEQEGKATAELKDKIVKIISSWAERAVIDKRFDGASVYSPHNAEMLADALIAAGLKFDTIVSHTATFDLMQQEQINRLKRQVANAEFRADLAERAFVIITTNMSRLEHGVNLLFAMKKISLSEAVLQAEKELAEEGDDDSRGNDEGE